MRRIAVIGSGTSGMLFAHRLLRAGYEVTVYSDRSAEDWLHRSPPTGTAFLYDCNIRFERELGLEHWAESMYHARGIHLDWQPTSGAERMVVSGLLRSDQGAAVDIRLRVHRWMNDFEAAGGRLVVGRVDAAALDRIAGQHELTALAVGKGELGAVVPRDPERSVYDRPQRNLAMCIVEGVDSPAAGRVDWTPIKFNFFADAGEYFWVPYTHKDRGRTWCFLFEPKPGGYLDRFGACAGPEDVVAVARELIARHAPYEWPNVSDMRPVADDPFCWLKGAVTPTVRRGFGHTASGHLVIPIGDTAITFDPIGGQGGNCAHRNCMFTAERIIEHGDAPFTEQWAEAVNAAFWAWHGRWAWTFNNILLEPLTEAGRVIMGTAAQSFEFASREFFGNIDEPRNFFPWFEDADAARERAAPWLPQAASR